MDFLFLGIHPIVVIFNVLMIVPLGSSQSLPLINGSAGAVVVLGHAAGKSIFSLL